VKWTEKLWDREVNLDHTFKAHVSNKGCLKVLVQKALTDNLTLFLTGHLDAHKLEHTKVEHLGFGLNYE